MIRRMSRAATLKQMAGEMSLPTRIGAVTLGTLPRVAVTLIAEAHGRRARTAWRAGADLLEVRVDGFRRLEPAWVCRHLKAMRRAGLPLIATIRLRAEGGLRAVSEPARLALFKAVLPLVDAVDIESAAPIYREVARAAARAGKTLIASYHNLRVTPQDAVLDRVIRRAGRNGPAKIVKIATVVHGPADVARLSRLLLRHPRLIVIGLGGAGAVTRVVFPLLGSLLTYGHAGVAAAPGQLPFMDVIAALRRYDPGYHRAWVTRVRGRTTTIRRAGRRSSP